MTTIFLLGPSEPKDPPRPRDAHMAVRRRLAGLIEAADHRCLLMEDLPQRRGEDLVEKFERILDEERPAVVLVYWPAKAKMQTTFDELLLLRKRSEDQALPQVIVLHEEGVADITAREFRILEPGGRSRYFEALRRVPITPISWSTEPQLEERVSRLAQTEV